MKSIRWLLSITCLLSLLGASDPIAASASPSAPDNLGTVTQIGTLESGTIQDLAVLGSYAYAGFGSTLVVIDITNPADMHRVASLQLAGKIQAIEADQDYLYVSSYGSGLWIVDIQNPLAPVKTGFYPSQSASVLAVQGDFAYLAANFGLEIVDIAIREDPRLAGFVNDLYIPLTDIAVKDDYLYMAKLGDNNIWIMDISNPVQPVYAGQYTLPSSSAWTLEFEIRNSTLYLAEDYLGFQVLDITAPAEPKLVGSLDTDGKIGSLATSGDRVYVSFEYCPEGFCQEGFEIIDVSDPSSPNIIGTYTSTESSGSIPIAASGGNVFLIRQGEVQSVDASLPSAPILVDSLESSLNAPNKIAIAGDTAYIIDYVNANEGSSQLYIADISNPYQPKVTGQLSFPSNFSPLTDVEISGNIVIVAQAAYPPGISRVYFIDVSDPQNPVEVGRFDAPDFDAQEGFFTGVGVQGDFVYAIWQSKVLADISGMCVLNISDPANPEQTSFYVVPPSNAGGINADVSLDGDYAYIATGGLVLDVSNPEDPVKVGEFDRGDEIALDGNLAYLASWPGVIILDISNPANPVEISKYDIQVGGISGLVVQDNYLYVSSQSGLSIVDISQPTTPTLAAFLPSAGGKDVSIQGKEIFFTSSEGFQILHLTGTISGVVKHPNRWPVPDMTILANGIVSATTTSTGAYVFQDLEPGSYSIVPSLEGYTFTPEQSLITVPPSGIANFTMLPFPVSAELTPAVATTLVYTDTQGLPTSLAFPAGAVASDTHVVITPTISADMAGSAFTGHAFDLAAYQGGAIVPDLSFNVPISITIQHSPMDMAVISDTASLALYRSEAGSWVKADTDCAGSPPQTVPEAGIFETAICQSGRYALYGPTFAIALPWVSYGSDVDEIHPP